MGNTYHPAQTSFNAGELSPLWAARVDMAKYGNGCHKMLNFEPQPEGPARRRAGTSFASEVKSSASRGWLLEFIYSQAESYVLEIGNNAIRFYTNEAQVLYSKPGNYSGATAYIPGDMAFYTVDGKSYYCKKATTGNAPPNATYWYELPSIPPIYEIPSPYSAADLTDSDGLFQLDTEQTGDVIFMTHPSYPPKKLIRKSATTWVIEDANITNGPFEDVDPDQAVTVYAGATTGAGITLTASSSIFLPQHVGTLFLLEQKKIDGYPVWEVGKAIALNAERRSDSNVYKALNAATTGTVKPTHREGAKYDGETGVQWQYLHSGWGVCRITAVAGATATADVISTLPSQAVGAGNASTKWAFAAWRSDTGYPSLVKIFRERLCFARGQQVWGSVAGDFENFANRDGAETLPDSAFSITIGSSETNAAVWMAADEALLLGTRGRAFAVREVTTAEVFGPGNIKAEDASRYGSRRVAPVKVGSSILFAQSSGRKIRDMRYTFTEEGYQATSLMVLSEHVLRGQMVQMKYAQEPSSIVWACCADGSLVGLTYDPEQDVVGWHPHSVGGGGIVESIAVIPAPDGTHDQVWMQVRRTINGTTKRFIEFKRRDWRSFETALEQATFSDASSVYSGLIGPAVITLSGGTTWAEGEDGTATISGAAFTLGDIVRLHDASGNRAYVRINATATSPCSATWLSDIPVGLRGAASTQVWKAATTFSGLSHLEGKEVIVLGDGAPRGRKTVSSGAITISEPTFYAVVGLPCDAELVTMRIEGGSGIGTGQGRMKRVHRCVARVHDSLGGSLGPEGAEEPIEYRSATTPMDSPPPIFTGDMEVLYPEGYGTDARIRVVCTDPLPFTLCGLYPQLVVEERN